MANFGILRDPQLAASFLGSYDQEQAKQAQSKQQAFQNDLALKQFGLQERSNEMDAPYKAARIEELRAKDFSNRMQNVFRDPSPINLRFQTEAHFSGVGKGADRGMFDQVLMPLIQSGDNSAIKQFASQFVDQDAINDRAMERETQRLTQLALLGKLGREEQAAPLMVEKTKAEIDLTKAKTAKEAKEAKAAEVKAQPKPIPASALKMQNEELEALSIASQMESQLQGFKKKIDSGELQLSPIGNLISKGRNVAGLSDENSRNFASFQATLEKLRNDSLRLNSGVQTEGDAQRAWNELLANINDPKVVSQRLEEIAMINKRAARLRELNIENLRKNFGADPLDTNEYKQPISQPQASKDTPSLGTKKGGYVYLGGDPANPSSWKAER